MAAQQLTCVDMAQHVKPKDFDITWGSDCRYWRLPNACDPSAELIMVCFLEMEAKANIDPCKRNSVQICFDVSATRNYSGFKNADVRIGAKIGAAGDYVFKKISLDGLVLNQRKTVHQEFDFEANPCAGDKTLHFGLFDTWTPYWKCGVKFHEARVYKTQHIQPKDFDITWGSDSRYWRLPNACDPAAELIKVCFLAMEAKADIDPRKRNHVQICFDVSATPGYRCFNKADVRIGAKIGAAGDYVFKKISLDGLVPNERKTVHAEFDFEANPCACDNTLHFSLYDIWTPYWKCGVKFHEARVSPLIGTC